MVEIAKRREGRLWEEILDAIPNQRGVAEVVRRVGKGELRLRSNPERIGLPHGPEGRLLLEEIVRRGLVEGPCFVWGSATRSERATLRRISRMRIIFEVGNRSAYCRVADVKFLSEGIEIEVSRAMVELARGNRELSGGPSLVLVTGGA